MAVSPFNDTFRVLLPMNPGIGVRALVRELTCLWSGCNDIPMHQASLLRRSEDPGGAAPRAPGRQLPPPPPPKGASGQRLVRGVVGVQNRGVDPPMGEDLRGGGIRSGNDQVRSIGPHVHLVTGHNQKVAGQRGQGQGTGQRAAVIWRRSFRAAVSVRDDAVSCMGRGCRWFVGFGWQSGAAVGAPCATVCLASSGRDGGEEWRGGDCMGRPGRCVLCRGARATACMTGHRRALLQFVAL